MNLTEKIDLDLKEAMRSKEADILSVLRLLKSAIKNAAITKGSELTEAEAIAVVEKQAKQRKDSIAQYQAGSREDLAKKENEELTIISKYLPAKLSKEDTVKLVASVISELGASSMQDMGRVMKEVMSRASGAVDAGLVSTIVKEKLS